MKRSPRNRLTRRRARLESLESRRLLAAGSDDLATLIDEFDQSSSISDWTRIHQSEGWNADQLRVWDVDQTQPGRMVMKPETVSWYENYRGPLAFKEVTGDFVFTTQIHISDLDEIGDSDADDVPDDAQFSLGGAMIRTPRDIESPDDWAPGGENYVFLSLGHGTNGNFTYEVKTTQASDSDLALTPTDTGTATLQIARLGDAVITLIQEPGEDWNVHQRFSRPDMPDTLQVGLVSYSDWGKAGDFDTFFHNSNVLVPGTTPDPTPAVPFNPDLVSGYEYARFARPEVPGELDDVDLVTEATDQQLLDFLGDIANQPATASTGSSSVSFHVNLTDDMGTPTETVSVGDEFFIEVSVDDLDATGSGVFSAYLDVLHDSELATVSGAIQFGSDFPNAQNADTSVAGLINELGGIGDAESTGGSPQLLARIPMTATAVGMLTVQMDAADQLPAHEVGLYGEDSPVDAVNQIFGTDSVNIEVTRIWHLAASPADTNDDGSVSPLDALRVINAIDLHGIFSIDSAPQAALDGPNYFLDVNNDGQVSPLDALTVINALDQQSNVNDIAVLSFLEDDTEEDWLEEIA